MLWERVGPVLPDLSGQPLIAALLGGVFVGIGVGLVVRAGGASGGDDVLALLLNKFTKLTLSKSYFMTDAIVLALSLTYIPAGRDVYKRQPQARRLRGCACARHTPLCWRTGL